LNEKYNVMPVQINEVIIRAVVDNNSTPVETAVPSNEATGPHSTDNEIAALVLEIIKEKNER